MFCFKNHAVSQPADNNAITELPRSVNVRQDFLCMGSRMGAYKNYGEKANRKGNVQYAAAPKKGNPTNSRGKGKRPTLNKETNSVPIPARVEVRGKFHRRTASEPDMRRRARRSFAAGYGTGTRTEDSCFQSGYDLSSDESSDGFIGSSILEEYEKKYGQWVLAAESDLDDQLRKTAIEAKSLDGYRKGAKACEKDIVAALQEDRYDAYIEQASKRSSTSRSGRSSRESNSTSKVSDLQPVVTPALEASSEGNNNGVVLHCE